MNKKEFLYSLFWGVLLLVLFSSLSVAKIPAKLEEGLIKLVLIYVILRFLVVSAPRKSMSVLLSEICGFTWGFLSAMLVATELFSDGRLHWPVFIPSYVIIPLVILYMASPVYLTARIVRQNRKAKEAFPEEAPLAESRIKRWSAARKIGLVLVSWLFITGSIVSAVLWIQMNIREEEKYEKYAKEIRALTYKVVPLNDERLKVLSEVEKTWKCTADCLNDYYGKGIQSMDLTPSVKNLIHLLNCPMPKWSWWSNEHNEYCKRLMEYKGSYLTLTVDRTIHTTDEGCKAVLQISENTILVFEDDKEGLRERFYSKESQKIDQAKEEE
jgi:hypothetical protein